MKQNGAVLNLLKRFEAAGIPYQKTLAGTKEPETGLIHHEWTWSVRDGNDENQR